MRKNENVCRYDDLGENKNRIYVRLASEKYYEDHIKQIPSEKYYDMLMIYYMKICVSKNSFITMVINYEHLKNWGMTESDLRKLAWENTLRDQKAKIDELQELLMELTGVASSESDEEKRHDDDFKVYVVSNELREYGAAVLFYPGVMKKAADIMGSDFYVIPSSVHECLLVKKDDSIKPLYLRDTLRCINKNEVLPKDILSDSIYEYDSASDRLIIDNL